jgi:hypothetical protein
VLSGASAPYKFFRASVPTLRASRANVDLSGDVGVGALCCVPAQIVALAPNEGIRIK